MIEKRKGLIKIGKIGHKIISLSLALALNPLISTNALDSYTKEEIRATCRSFRECEEYKKNFIITISGLLTGSAIGMFIGGIVNVLTNIRNISTILAAPAQKIKYKVAHKGIDFDNYEDLIDRIEKRLKKEVIGQDEAIDKIIMIMSGYFESVKEAKENGKKFEGGLILYFIGEPATGKSTVMKIIQEEMGLNSCVCRMSDAIEDNGNRAMSVASRLIKPIKLDTGKVVAIRDTAFMSQVKNKRPTLYCIDEIDKMRAFDCRLQKTEPKDENGYIVGGSIDELLRNFGDTGQINGIDASGSILIVTSNESEEQIKNLESSLYNRYNDYLVKFKNLNSEDYKKIINNNTADIKNYYKKKYGVDIEWDEDSLNKISEMFSEKHLGGRAVNAMMKILRFKLVKAIKSRTLNRFNIKFNKEIFVEETG